MKRGRYRVDVLVGKLWIDDTWFYKLESAQVYLVQQSFNSDLQYRIIDTQEPTRKELRDG